MSNYLLYGLKMIENDDTLKDFAKSICNGVDTSALTRGEDFKDEFMDMVWDALADDISRTDIDYEELMHKYRFEIGDLLYEIENHCGEIPTISFFGDDARGSFNLCIERYIDIYFDELVSR